MGAVLALVESLGLGAIGADHYLMKMEAESHGEMDVARQHTTFAYAKLSF